MANCLNHPETAATAYCRTCGKPLCDTCHRDVRGVIYCEECIAARLAGTMPPAAGPVPPGLPNPTLAAFLGFIPGVGAFYNGQYQKGILHILMFPALIALSDINDIFVFFFLMYYFYMVVDAYQTAKAKVEGRTPPDYLRLNQLFGSAERPISAAFGERTTPDEADPAPTTPQPQPSVPLGPIILISLGLLFLMSTTGMFPQIRFSRVWPLLLIIIGLYQGYQRLQNRY